MGYTKREFLKILGLGLVFMPLASCFSAADDKKKADDTSSEKPEEKSDSNEGVKASESDVLVLKRDDAAYEKFNQGFNKRLHFLPKYIFYT